MPRAGFERICGAGRSTPTSSFAARASELLLDVVRSASHDLIVTGIARSTGLARAILGATVEALLEERAAPVLVVKRRVREAYRSALVGTDFSAHRPPRCRRR